MNRYKLSKAGINTSEGIARLGGSAEAYERLLSRFPDEPHFRRMRDAVRRRDAASAYEAAHALKGAVGNLSMYRLYSSLCPLVDELRKGSLKDADALMERIEGDYNEVVAALARAPGAARDAAEPLLDEKES